jgi:glycosyltransferase involved in cell wall biosynthesis
MPTRTTVLYIQPVAERGGSDQALVRMIRTLPREAFDCHVVVPGPSPMAPALRAAGATVHVVPMRRLTGSGGLRYRLGYIVAWPATVARLSGVARRIGADVIHTNSLHSLYGWAVALRLRRPHVWHAREIVVQSGAALRVERFLARRFAVVVVAISDAVAAMLGLPNTEVILDDVDPETFGPQRAGRARASLGIGDDVPLVVFAGRLDVWKGLDVLLDALPAIRSKEPDAELVVAGPTVTGKEAYAAHLEARSARLGGVHWLGPRDDVADLVADADVVAAPSTFPEPYGLVLVEALASGTPVVTTDMGGAAEVAAAAGDGARAVPPDDPAALAAAVVELLGSSPATTRPRTARSRLWMAPAADWAALYERVRRRRRRR